MQRLEEYGARMKSVMEDWRVGSPIAMSDSHVAFDFNQAALELFAIQYERVEIFREWCKFKSVSPSNADAWDKIPPLPIGTFKNFRVSGIERGMETHEFLSSGTTSSVRSRHIHFGPSLALYRKSLLTSFENLFIEGRLKEWEGDIVRLIPRGSEAPTSSLAHMMDVVEEEVKSTGKCEVFSLASVNSDGKWEVDFDLMKDWAAGLKQASRPVIMAGTAFSYVHLMDWLSESDTGPINLPMGSLVMETGGYKGQSRELTRQELHASLNQFLGITNHQIITEYGMSELCSQAYRIPGPPPNPFVTPPWMRVRIIDPESGDPVLLGEPGVIQIFDLANVWSVMAVETEDLGALWQNGFEIIGRTESSQPKGCSLFETSLSSLPDTE